MNAKNLIPALLAFGLGTSTLSGCLVRGGATIGVEGPELAYVGPGVYVVSDYDQPVFYSDGFYWLYTDGFWYRSGYYNRGWVRWGDVPIGIRGIARPRAYVHYRGHGPVYRRNEVDHRERMAPRPVERDRRVPPPGDRDRRVPPPAGDRDHRPAPPPPAGNRDHRPAPPPASNRDHRPPPPKPEKDKRDHR